VEDSNTIGATTVASSFSCVGARTDSLRRTSSARHFNVGSLGASMDLVRTDVLVSELIFGEIDPAFFLEILSIVQQKNHFRIILIIETMAIQQSCLIDF
jgi:hypothetical protein